MKFIPATLIAPFIKLTSASNTSLPGERIPIIKAIPRDILLDNIDLSSSGTPRIVGGTNADNYIDYQVLLLLDFGDGFFGRCGASLIAPNVVLSAAHCQAENVGQYVVVTGLENISSLDSSPLPETVSIRSVQQQIVHPNYRMDTVDNDVMLLKLSQSVDNMKPIALDENISSLTVGQSVRVSGWGTTSFQGSTSESLLYADLRYISNSACNNVYGVIDEFEMCAYEDGKDACQGDSGGPLVISEYTNGEPLLVGVVSWGYECASPGVPGVYARVSYFYNWISNNGCAWYGSLCTSPTSSPTPRGPTSSPVPTSTCTDFPGFVDSNSRGCEWYEINDEPGCPTYGNVGRESLVLYAGASCCYCYGGETDGGFCELGEEDVEGWTDNFGGGCYWYATYDEPGCPNYGDYWPNVDGTTAEESCCYCRNENGSNPMFSSSHEPSEVVTVAPRQPSAAPMLSGNPVYTPTMDPSWRPSSSPIFKMSPSHTPTTHNDLIMNPSFSPTVSPTIQTTPSPTSDDQPSNHPTTSDNVTLRPSISLTASPTSQTTASPTVNKQSSNGPTSHKGFSMNPSLSPSSSPILLNSHSKPSHIPTAHDNVSMRPSSNLSTSPTMQKPTLPTPSSVTTITPSIQNPSVGGRSDVNSNASPQFIALKGFTSTLYLLCTIGIGTILF